MLSRPCWILAMALVFSGCFALTNAERDSDEEQWHAQWGSEDMAASKSEKKPQPVAENEKSGIPDNSKTEEIRTVKAEKHKAEKPKAKAPVEKTSMSPGAGEPPKKPPEIEQPPEPAPPPEPARSSVPAPMTEAKPPVVMYPPEGGVDEPKASGKDESPSAVSPAVEPEKPVKHETERAASSQGGPWVFIDLRGGMLISQKGKLMPAGFVFAGVNLGRLIGWQGLLAGVGADVSSGSDQLGNTDFVLLDASLGIRGRIPLGPVRILVGLGFVLRNAFVTNNSGDSQPSSELGLGVLASAGVELPIWGPIGIAVVGDGRYIKDPFTSKFVFSSGVGGGVTLEF